jgi:hypothetical protein
MVSTEQIDEPPASIRAATSVAVFMAGILKTVNLEEGMPSIPQARARMASELQSARHSAISVLKIIHGYGSSGVGGELRIALQSTLRQMAQRGEIRACIYGENWRESDESAWELVKRIPTLKADRDFGKGNRGITIVVL